MFLGLGISTIGVDLQSGVHRFTFGLPHLTDGINYIVIIIGIYAMGEVLYNLLKPKHGEQSNGLQKNNGNGRLRLLSEAVRSDFS